MHAQCTMCITYTLISIYTRWLWNCDGLGKPLWIERKKQQQQQQYEETWKQQQQPSWKIREQTFQGGKMRTKKWNERIVLNHHAHYIHFKSGHTLTAQVHARAHTNRLHTLQLSLAILSAMHAWHIQETRTSVRMHKVHTHTQIGRFKLVANYRLYQNTINVMHKCHGQYANTPFCLSLHLYVPEKHFNFILCIRNFCHYRMMRKVTELSSKVNEFIEIVWMMWKRVNYYVLSGL